MQLVGVTLMLMKKQTNKPGVGVQYHENKDGQGRGGNQKDSETEWVLNSKGLFLTQEEGER